MRAHAGGVEQGNVRERPGRMMMGTRGSQAATSKEQRQAATSKEHRHNSQPTTNASQPTTPTTPLSARTQTFARVEQLQLCPLRLQRCGERVCVCVCGQGGGCPETRPRCLHLIMTVEQTCERGLGRGKRKERWRMSWDTCRHTTNTTSERESERERET